jgi:hypothetical protein
MQLELQVLAALAIPAAARTRGHRVASINYQPGDTEHGPALVSFPEPSLADKVF